jgi:hypothetical protein
MMLCADSRMRRTISQGRDIRGSFVNQTSAIWRVARAALVQMESDGMAN